MVQKWSEGEMGPLGLESPVRDVDIRGGGLQVPQRNMNTVGPGGSHRGVAGMTNGILGYETKVLSLPSASRLHTAV